MCCLCNWFAWSFDFIQRVVTFLLTCCLCFAVCFGLSLAIITGIAYGYNYSMAEWLTFTRSDVTVYMRRGQFYDRPDVRGNFRRAGEDYDLFPTYNATDYEDNKSASNDIKPLSDSWVKTQDARKYAEKLTKYNTPYKMDSFTANQPMPTRSPNHPGLYQSTAIRSRLISIKPNPVVVDTTLWESGSSQIVMRNFEAIEDVSAPSLPEVYPDPDSQSPVALDVKDNIKLINSKRLEDSQTRYVPMRVWATVPHQRYKAAESIPDETEDDNIIYKPV